MPLKNCPSCNGTVSPQAETCPHCGHPLKKKPAARSSGCGALILLALLIGTALIVSNYPDDTPPTQAELAAESERIAAEQKARHEQIEQAIRQRQVIVGMTRDDVQRSWGKPETINQSGGAYGSTEQWVYHSAWLYFEEGILTSWQVQK